MAQATPTRTPLRPLLPLYLVIFTGYIGYGMMVTLFVQMLLDRGSGFVPPGASTAYRTQLTGVLLALYPIGQFFGTPVLSSLSDRFGRKPVLLASLCGTTGCYVLVAVALQLHSIPLLCAALVLCGLAESNVAIAESAIADVSSDAEKGRLFGYVYIAVRLGYVFGPMIGGQAVERTRDYALPFWVVVGLLLVAIAWTQAHFKETHPPEPGRPLNYLRAFTSLSTIFTDRPIRTLYLLNFLLYVAIFGFSRTILMYLVDGWHMGPGKITFFYSYFAGAVLVANLWVMPWLSSRVPLTRLAIWSAVIGGAMTILLAVVRAEFWLWALIGPSSCLLSVCLSASAAILSNAVAPEQQGQVMGNNEALQVAGQAAGAAGGGSLAAIWLPLPLVVYGALVIVGAGALARYRVPRSTAAG